MNKPYYQDLHNTLYQMDFRKNELPDESVQMVVTSPPYWGLRKYSGEQALIWGGDKDCEHEWGSKIPMRRHKAGETNPGKEYYTKDTGQWADNAGGFCIKCGAWRGSFGLEPTPEMYVQHTIEILREIRRVLRKDGVVFWNIGDSYASSPPGNKKELFRWQHQNKPEKQMNESLVRRSTITGGMKPKDLCLIPFRVAIAAQEDGWWVRSVIIWNKPNPMPESVTDRPTESHEYILLLTRSARYYWDQEAVREQSISTSFGADQRDTSITHGMGGGNSGINEAKRRAREAGTFGSRNLRSVWTFPTRPYPEAHFAVFPEKLPELCIKAATPEVGCCAECGAPWERIVEKIRAKPQRENWRNQEGAEGRSDYSEAGGWYDAETKTTGWQPTCKCNADKVPSIVLDPFAGAGTTLWVAKKLNRKGIGFDISEEYCKLAVDRIRQQVML